ncbi:MAG: helix-turn-helix domain-containing protein [Halobacteria archaeon]
MDNENLTYQKNEVKPALLRTLGKKYSCRILEAASSEPRSVKEFSKQLNIPKTTLYRRVRDLTECGLLKEEGKLDREGNHHKVYTSNIEKIEIELNQGSLSTRVKLQDQPDKKLIKI